MPSNAKATITILAAARARLPKPAAAVSGGESLPGRPVDGAPSRNDRDRVLIAAIALGDRAAFRELYLHYHRRIARFLTRITARYDLAEEIINDTFWVVWQRAGQFQGASSVSTWIMGIAYRRGLKTLRKMGSRPGAEAVREADQEVHEPWSQNELREWLAAALARLPLEQRMVLELAYHVGHSCEEIAEIMNCPVNTVKTRMYHGRQKLRLLLPQLAGIVPE